MKLQLLVAAVSQRIKEDSERLCVFVQWKLTKFRNILILPKDPGIYSSHSHENRGPLNAIFIREDASKERGGGCVSFEGTYFMNQFSVTVDNKRIKAWARYNKLHVIRFYNTVENSLECTSTMLVGHLLTSRVLYPLVFMNVDDVGDTGMSVVGIDDPARWPELSRCPPTTTQRDRPFGIHVWRHE